MLMFKLLFKHPQFLELTGMEDGKKISESSRTEMISLLKNARIFVIQNDLLAYKPSEKTVTQIIKERISYVDSTDNYSNSSCAIPFPVCWFEAGAGSDGLVNFRFNTLPGVNHGRFSYATAGMLVKETSPNTYDLFTVEVARDNTLNEDEKDLGSNISIFRNVSSEGIYIASHNDAGRYGAEIALRRYLDAINAGSLGVEICERIVHIPRPDRIKKTRPHTINQIVRIVPKNLKEKTLPLTQGAEIDWSHRWEVRGHWRKIELLGKDRSGEYCVNGFTWVKDHIRGPEHLPIVKKTRVVK